MKILVLGAGFGGLELSTRLADRFGSDVDIILIDQNPGFVFGFSKLDVMFGKASPSDVFHSYEDVTRPGLRFVQAAIQSIDPAAKSIKTEAGTFDSDILVVALGADLDPGATPGLVEGGNEFYTVAGAFGLRDILPAFPGGRVIIGVTSTPFKCPPAPSETALLLHDSFSQRGIRGQSTISLVMPLPVPIPPSPAASEALLVAFAERGINWIPERCVTELVPDRKLAKLSDGEEMPYDLYLGVPVHRVPSVVEASGLTVDGWIPVDPFTLETVFPDVYAIGDVTSVGTPKAGVFSEGQGEVVAEHIAARILRTSDPKPFDGRGICYLEFGSNMVGRVEVTFMGGQAPKGGFEGPSLAIAKDKAAFGTDRIQRWFGRSWGELPAS